MPLKDELLETAEKQDAELFVSFMSKYLQKKSQLQDIEEALSSMGTSQVSEVWENIHLICTSVLLSLDENEEEMNQECIQKNYQMLRVLESIVALASAALLSDTPSVPDSFFDTAVIMHGVLLSLPEAADKLKNSMSKVFETWWTRDLRGKEELGIHTLTYLLEQSLMERSPLIVVKRVWSVRMAVKPVDVFNSNFEHIRGLLLHCFMHTTYLKHEEGRRFLSFLFGFGPNMIELLHRTIKNQLPITPGSIAVHYGEVYFRAWRVASGECLKKIENSCIQDLMHIAVHVSRSSLAHVLRKVLGYIHNQKKHKGVEEMLVRLYEPILWRSLKVANGAVRLNAASLLVDVFPLLEMEVNVVESDSLLQKQFDLLQKLMSDPCVAVRTVTVAGVCQIISKFWEFIPEPVLRTLITELYKDVVFDISSADVRVAVIKGQLDLLDNHLCHPLLKPLLPTLQNFIHDPSEKVRLSMLELLIKVKSIRGIKFWSIAPMEHLLARLEVDTAPVARRIVKLIFNMFVPIDKGRETLLSRCLALLRSNPGAARIFFQYANNHLPVVETVLYITCLCRFVLSCVRREQKKSGTSLETSSENIDRDEQMEDNKENIDSDYETSVHNVDDMAGLLEAMAILWSGVTAQLGKAEYAELQEELRRKFAIAMPEFLKSFEDRRCYAALIHLSGLMPPQLVPHYSRSSLSRLQDMPEDSNEEDYWILLEAMCKWGKIPELLEIIYEWLEDGLKITALNESARKAKTKKNGKKTVAFKDPRTPKPKLAIKYLSSIICNPSCQKLVLLNCAKELQELSALLASITQCFEKRFGSPSELGPRTTDDFLTEAFTMYQKLELLLHNSEDTDHNAVVSIENLFAWAARELLSTPTVKEEDESFVSRKRKLKAEDSKTQKILATDLIQSLLHTGSNILLVGIGDANFTSQYTDFILLTLQTDKYIELLPLVVEALYQILEQWRTYEAETCPHSSLVSTLYSKLLQSMAAHVNHDDHPLTLQEEEKVRKMLSDMKSTVTELLQAVYKCKHLDSLLVPDLMASTVAAVVSDMKHHSKLGKLDHDELCKSLEDLPLLSAFLLEIIFKKNYMATSFSEELYECIKCGAVSGLHGLDGAVYLTANLYHAKPSLSGLKDCFVNLQVQANKLETEMSGHDINAPERMVLTGLMTRLRQTQDGLTSG